MRQGLLTASLGVALVLLAAGLAAGAETVTSGTSTNLVAYRAPYGYLLPSGKTPADIVGIGIAGSNDHVYVWFRDWTVSSGTSGKLHAYRAPYAYKLPAGKTPNDVVAIAIAGSNDHVYAWYRDLTVSSGTSSQLDAYRPPYAYVLPDGKSPDDIVGIGIAGSNDHVYAWYRDGTVSSGNSSNLAAYRPRQPFATAPGTDPSDLVDLGIAGSNDHVYAWYAREVGTVPLEAQPIEIPGPVRPVTGAAAIEVGGRIALCQSPRCDPDEGTFNLCIHEPNLMYDLESRSFRFTYDFDHQTRRFREGSRAPTTFDVVQGLWSGTKGRSWPLCSLVLWLENAPPERLSLTYMCHLAGQGDTGWGPEHAQCGFNGIEGFAAALRGPHKDLYTVRYRCHIADVGDTGWFADGEYCGARGQGWMSLEAIQIEVRRR